MKKIFKNFLFAMMLLVIASCAKEGPLGPEGPAGPVGPKGEQGGVGVKGADGTIILNGTTDPGSDLGKVGDFYINTKDGLLYGPKSASGWGASTSLKGAEGAAGSKFLSGDNAPDNAVGKLGDFYFRLSNATLYGPRDANGWGSGVKLMGNANVKEGSGWTQLLNDNVVNSGQNWERDYRAWNMRIESPGDIGGYPYFFDWYLGSFNLHSGAFVVYVDDGNAIKMCNFQTKVLQYDNNQNVKIDADLEFRFVVAPITAPTMAHMLYPVVALKRGVADEDYMTKVYLPSLKWKVVSIPANIAKSGDLDLSNYEAVMNALKSN